MNEYSTTSGAGRSRSGFVNALLGAVVMVVFSWIPFAPVVGGALSGYLEAEARDGTRSVSRRGVRVGALAGLLAAIPALLVIALVGSVFTVGWVGLVASGGGGPRVALGLPVLAWVLVAVVVAVAVLYHVAFSALGGWLGAELATRDDHASAGHDTGYRDSAPAERPLDEADDDADGGPRSRDADLEDR
ncbi:DUF5518 domain-containing protein [Halorubellus sp. PRR65]|uniref:DUF5518 domain-containing protein n=1 Tax=Halorubellus sp. PRR65 TaxID=3098148 RepID=UPI002B25D591|nr:DUF5518 domain-containing protein [Halorubellus sp. PRR65]